MMPSPASLRLSALSLPLLIAGAYASDLSLKVMSFNVQQPYNTNWDGRRDRCVAVIAQEAPDVLGSQEAVNYQRDYLAGKLAHLAWFGSGRDGADAGEGSWIFYRKDRFALDSAASGNFWLSNTPDKPSRYGGSYNRLCTFIRLVEKSTGRGFHVFNVHMYLPEQTDYRRQAAKMLAAAMAERVKKGEPVLATGDFNSVENDAVTAWIKSGADNPVPMRDTYRDVHPTGNVVTGFGVKLDYIYVENTARYKTQAAAVVGTHSGASDHVPITATITVAYEDPTALLRGGDRPGRYAGTKPGPDRAIFDWLGRWRSPR